VVTVFGSKFGVTDTTPKLKFTHTKCHPSHWTSDSSLRCKVPAGSEASINIIASVELLVGLSTRIFTFDAPTISSVSKIHLSSTGSNVMNVFGKEFSFEDRTPSSSMAVSSSQITKWLSDTSLLVKLSSGIGNLLSLTITINVVVVFGFLDFFSFDSTQCSSISVSNSPTTGSLKVSAFGLDFGLSDYSSLKSLRFVPTMAKSTLWVSNSNLQSKPAGGSGLNISASLTYGNSLILIFI
jgi:hypothetical protein